MDDFGWVLKLSFIVLEKVFVRNWGKKNRKQKVIIKRNADKDNLV